jgi:ribosomal protein L7/L12
MNDSWATAAAIASVAFALAVYYTASAWFAHRERMAKIAQSIDPDRRDQPIPRHPLSDRVKQLAGDPARKIEAIKAYREETGAGLPEAKEAVEAFLNGK